MNSFSRAPAIDVRLAKQGGFYQFVIGHFSAYEGVTYIDNWHIRSCCEVLERRQLLLHADTQLQLPPGHMKSSLLSLYQLWIWACLDPGRRFFFGSYSKTLGKREAEKMAALMKSDGWKKRWPGVHLIDAKTPGRESADPATTVLHTSKGGMRFSSTPRGEATGWHFDDHIYDDMHKASELTSTALENVSDWVTTTMATRWRGNRRNRIVGMQRLHARDLCGVLHEQSSYPGAPPSFRIVLPLEFDPALHEHLRLTSEERAVDQRTTPGELVHPARFDDRTVEVLKATIGAVGNREAQLQMNPGAGGGKVFRREWFARRWSHDTLPTKFDSMIETWDMTFDDEGLDPDYVAGQRWAIKGHDIYLLSRAPTLRRDLPSSVRAVLDFRAEGARTWPGHPCTVVVEKKANGAGILKLLRGSIPLLVPYDPQGSKIERAATASVPCEAMRVFLGPNDLDLIETMINFPAVAHDDEVDALSMGINFLSGKRRAMNDALGSNSMDAIAKRMGLR